VTLLAEKPITCPSCGKPVLSIGDKWCCENGECGARSEGFDALLDAVAPGRKFKGLGTVAAKLMAKSKVAASVDAMKRLARIAEIVDAGSVAKEKPSPTPAKPLSQRSIAVFPNKPPERKRAASLRMPDYKSDLKILIRTGLLAIESKGSNDELRRWLKNHAPAELQDKINNPRHRRFLQSYISEVRVDMQLPAAN
jgi:hypothetical protein